MTQTNLGPMTKVKNVEKTYLRMKPITPTSFTGPLLCFLWTTLAAGDHCTLMGTTQKTGCEGKQWVANIKQASQKLFFLRVYKNYFSFGLSKS